MPFRSKAQRRWMYANNPAMAERWEAETPKGRLPARKGSRTNGKRKKNRTKGR